MESCKKKSYKNRGGIKSLIRKIKVEEVNSRLDSYISQKEEISRMAVGRLLEEGKIMVNRKNTKGFL